MKILKLLAIVMAFLLFFGALMYGIGSFMPESHTATLSRSYSASQGQLWDLITNYPEYASWRSDVEKVELIDSVTWREYYSHGDILTFQQLEKDSLNYLKTEIADKNLPFGGNWEYTLLAKDENTTWVEITENGEVYNPLFRFINGVFMDQTATIQTFLNDLELKVNGESHSD